MLLTKKQNEDILRSVQVMQHAQQARDWEVNSEGRYRCRAQGCPKTFAHDGKLRSEHEASHNPLWLLISVHLTHLLSTPTEVRRTEMIC